MNALGLSPSPSPLPGYAPPFYETPDGRCRVVVVMTTEDAVSIYKDAGDPVAENGAGTVGVKVVAAHPFGKRDQHCVDELSAKLENAF